MIRARVRRCADEYPTLELPAFTMRQLIENEEPTRRLPCCGRPPGKCTCDDEGVIR